MGRPTSTIATVDYDGRGALQPSRPLHAGLRAGAKASDRHHLLAAGAARRRRAAHLVPRPRDHRSTSTAWPPASSITTRTARSISSAAEIVIIAGNGVGTPRLMLFGLRQHPERPRQLSGPGRQEPDAPSLCASLRLFDEPMTAIAVPSAAACWSQEFYETDPARDFVRGYTFQFGRGDAPMPRGDRVDQRGSRALGRGPSPRLPRAWSTIASACRRSVRICPTSTTASTLDPVLKDSNGIPAPKIDYRICDNSRKMIDHGIERAKEVLERGRRQDPRRQSRSCHTAAGTCSAPPAWAPTRSARWSTSGAAATTSRISSSSTAASSSPRAAVNPTSTIQAIALYIADQHQEAPRQPVRLSLPMHDHGLSATEVRDLRLLAGQIIPPSAAYGVPGADDDLIFGDILKTSRARPRRRSPRAGRPGETLRRHLRRSGRCASHRSRRRVA